MNRHMQKAITALKRLTTRDFYSHRVYIRYFDRLPVDGHSILLESQHGTTLGGNIAAILKTLCADEEFAGFTMYVTVRKNTRDAIEKQCLSFTGAVGRVHTVEFDSFKYYRIMASAGFLINDNTFCPMFMKKPGQKYLNTWHGTPLKTLGKAIKGERFAIGNAQRNFLHADLLLYPNEYTRDIFMRDYMIENFGTAHVAVTGYPRNEVLCAAREENEKKEPSPILLAYLPTWRGVVGKVDKDEQKAFLKGLCDGLEERLAGITDRDVIIYIKLHPVLRDALLLDGYRHVRPFPADVPMYDFLAGTDGLITDYSSIMFDYAVTGRKIVLYTYDEEEYFANRGTYFGLDELPFPKVRDVEALVREILSPKQYDDTEFLRQYCRYDRVGVTKELLHNFLFTDLAMYPEVPSNGRRNVVVYGGDFIRNGIATAVTNLMRQIDHEKYNYLVLYKLSPRTNSQPGYHEPALDGLPEDIATLGMTNPHCGTAWELVCSKGWKRLQRVFPGLPFKASKRAYEAIARREALKTFGEARIDAAIQFNGYFPDVIEMFKCMGCGRAIYVHNDMNGENKKSYSVPKKLLADAYAQYDEVAVVTDELKQPMARFMESGGQPARGFTTSLNVIDYQGIMQKAGEELRFDEQTECGLTAEQLQEILDSDEIKFINIGRFSYEKGQLRLIEAFEKAVGDGQTEACTSDADGGQTEACTSDAAGDGQATNATSRPGACKTDRFHQLSRLIILGSYGPQYDAIKARAASSPLADRITIIKFMSNPYPLLKKCDYFVLSSLYEGFGLVLCEADILGVPCFAPRIVGPAGFMDRYGGMLVEDSTDGIADGMRLCMQGKVKKTLNCDYEAYNREAAGQFEGIVARLVGEAKA